MYTRTLALILLPLTVFVISACEREPDNSPAILECWRINVLAAHVAKHCLYGRIIARFLFLL